MQQQSGEMCSRLDRLQARLDIRVAELAEKIGLSESMFYQVKSGKRAMSPRAMQRLENAEKEAGIEGPFTAHLRRIRTVASVQESPESGDSLIMELAQLEGELAQWKARAHAAEKTIEQIMNGLERVKKAAQSQFQSQG